MGGPASIPFISCIPLASFEHEKAAAAEHPRLPGGPQGPAPAGSNPSSSTISPIDSLSDDCLLLVFSRLTQGQRCVKGRSRAPRLA